MPPRPIRMDVEGTIPLSAHEAKWSGCQACPLGKIARRKVFWRSSGPRPGEDKLPLMFIAEAPAWSEDTIGVPLAPAAPAGGVFEDMLHGLGVLAQRYGQELPPWVACNVVACLSAEWTGQDNGQVPQLKLRAPNRQECEACRPRLKEFLRIVRPRWVVLLGGTAATHATPAVAAMSPMPTIIRVKHPGSILHKGDPDQALPYYVAETATAIGGVIFKCSKRQ